MNEVQNSKMKPANATQPSTPQNMALNFIPSVILSPRAFAVDAPRVPAEPVTDNMASSTVNAMFTMDSVNFTSQLIMRSST